MDLQKIKESLLLIVGAFFAVAGIYQIALPVDEALVSDFIAALFALLGAIMMGYAERDRSFAFAAAYGVQAINFDKLRSAGAVVISLIFGLLGIWQIAAPIDEAIVQQLFALIILVLSGFYGGVNAKDYRVAAAAEKKR